MGDTNREGLDRSSRPIENLDNLGKMSDVFNRMKRAAPQRWLRAARGAFLKVRYKNNALEIKHHEENAFWSNLHRTEGLLNGHFEYLFVDAFGLSADWFAGKRMLDIGCGPTGSLEWATMAAERVGLDPLVDNYRSLGIEGHAMQYVNAPSESIPFPTTYFDVVSSFNLLDHVDELDQTVDEIKRVVTAGGTLLIIVEVNHSPTIAEPISLSWDLPELFAPAFTLVEARRYPLNPNILYEPILAGRQLSGASSDARGVLLARLERAA